MVYADGRFGFDKSLRALALTIVASPLGCFEDSPTAGSTGSSESGEATGSSDADESTTEQCVVETVAAAPIIGPTDLIVAVDTSLSMIDNFSPIDDALATLGPALIADPSAHLLLVSTMPAVAGEGVCVPAALTGIACPGEENDSSPPRYERASVDTASQDALDAVAEAVVESGFLRVGGSKHIVIISDQDTEFEVTDALALLMGLGPDFTYARVHTASGPAGALGCDDDAPRLRELVERRGGVEVPLCPSPPETLWDAVLAPQRACEIEVPPSPHGPDDPGPLRIDLEIRGAIEPIELIDAFSDCTPGAQAMLDDVSTPPTLRLCPEVCRSFQDASDASVLFRFGC